MDDLVGLVLVYVGVPMIGIAWLVTLGMRFRLRKATNLIDKLVAAQANDAHEIAALKQRVAHVESVVAGRQGIVSRPLAGIVAPLVEMAGEIKEIVTGRAQPDAAAPAMPREPARVAAFTARHGAGETISEEAPIPAVLPEVVKVTRGAPMPFGGVGEEAAAARAERPEPSTTSPAGGGWTGPKEPEEEKPEGIVISADAWTGRHEEMEAPAPRPSEALVLVTPGPAESETPAAAEETPPEPQSREEEPEAAEALAPEQPGEFPPGEEPEQEPALETGPVTIIPFPGPAQTRPDVAVEPAATGIEEAEKEVEEEEEGEALGPRVRHAGGAVPSVPAPPEEPEPEAEPAVAAMASAARADVGAFAQVLKSGSQAVARLAERGDTGPRNWETLIGGRWLNLIGIVLLVVGVVLLTQWAFHYLEPAEKMAVGVGFALVLLACGVILEHRSAYRRIGSTLVGGGWALLYFDSYAASNVEQVQVIHDPSTGLVAMAAVAAGMVGHSLRYRSQFITSVAFGLGYLAVLLTPVSLQSLVASALLAAGLAVVAWAMSWQYLLASGVIAAYSNHWFWLQKVASAQSGGPTLPIGENNGFLLSSAVLVFYWAIFAAVSLSRRMDKEMNRQLHLSVGVANAVGMLGLITLQLTQGYGSQYLAFLTGPAALGYVVLARGEYRLGQRMPFLFAASLALLLYGITLPLAHWDHRDAIDLGWLAPVLLVGALLAIGTGIRVAETLLRGEGYLAAAISFGLLAIYNLERPDAAAIAAVWFAAPAMVVAYQAAAEWLRRQESGAMRDLAPAALLFGAAAALTLAHVLWVQLPRDMVGLAWLAVGLVVLEAGARLPRFVLRGEGYLLAGLAFAGLALLNLGNAVALPIPTLPRPAILLLAAAGFYGMAWRLMAGGWLLSDHERRLAWLPSAAGSILVVAAGMLDLPQASICGPLALWAVVLFETGLRGGGLPVRIQGYAVMACAAATAMVVNGTPAPFGSAPGLQSWGPLLVTVAGLWWLYRRLVLQQPAVLATEGMLGAWATFVANALSAEILWKQLPIDLVALAWIAGGILLFEVALRLDRVLLRAQAYAVLALAFLLLLAANFDPTWPRALTVSRWLSVGPAVAVYYAFTARLERGTWPRTAAERSLAWAPSALASALVVLLVWSEVERNLVTATLSAWALVLIEVGRRVHWLPIRMQGYALVLLGGLAALRLNGYPAPEGTAPGPGSWGPLLVTVALLWWHFRRFCVLGPDDHPLEGRVPDAASAMATLLTAQILLKELPVDTVGLAWLAVGLVLFEVSALVGRPALRFEGYVMQALAAAALLVVNCGSAIPLVDHATAPRWALVIPGIAGLYYSSARLLAGAAKVTAQEIVAGWVPSAFATLLVAALAALELEPGLLAGAFSLWGFVLFEAGLRTRQVMIRLQGHALVGAAAVLAVVVNVSGVPVGFGGAPMGGPSEWGPVLVTAAVLAWLFVRLAVRPVEGAAAFEHPLGEWASCAASLLLALLVWKEMPSLAVAVLWCALGFALFQISQPLRAPILRAQAHVLLGAAYVRLYMANFVAMDQAGPLSLRLVTVLPVLLSLYCVMEQLRGLEPATRPGLLGRILRFEGRAGTLACSWAGFFGLVVLCRFEFGKEHTVAAWSALVLLFQVLGQRLDRQDFRFQSYGLAIYAVFRAWDTNLYLDGTWLKMPERISTTLPMIAVLFVVAVAIAQPRTVEARPGRSRLVRLFNWLDGRAHTLFAILASVFTGILLYYQLDANTLSIGLALEGFCLLALGLVINDRVFRLFGLGLLLVCLVKLMVYDLRGVETIYRIMSFIVLGLVLLLASFGYARYRDKIEKLI